MSARTPYSAVRLLEVAFQRSVSCITDDKVLVSRYGREPTTPESLPRTLTLAHDVVPLDSDEGLRFAPVAHYRVVLAGGGRLWRTESAAYYFQLRDLDEREMLAYHWHPEEAPAVDFPHLHLGHGAVDLDVLARAALSPSHNALRRDLATAHLPTHRITVDGVVRLAIEQLGVQPRLRNWDRILRQARSFFEREQTWL